MPLTPQDFEKKKMSMNVSMNDIAKMVKQLDEEEQTELVILLLGDFFNEQLDQVRHWIENP